MCVCEGRGGWVVGRLGENEERKEEMEGEVRERERERWERSK